MRTEESLYLDACAGLLQLHFFCRAFSELFLHLDIKMLAVTDINHGCSVVPAAVLEGGRRDVLCRWQLSLIGLPLRVACGGHARHSSVCAHAVHVTPKLP